MSNPRVTFEEHDLYGHKVFRFFDDRIELEWQECSNTGREVYHDLDLAEGLEEQTTFAYDARRTLVKFALFLVAGLTLHLGFSHPILHWVAFGLYALSLLAAILLLLKIRKDTWLYVYKADGSLLFCFREAGLRGINRSELISEIRQYRQNTKSANKTAHPTAGNVLL